MLSLPNRPTPPDSTAKLAARIARHQEVASAIEGLSDEELLDWLSASPALLQGGHASVSLPGSDATVFVKLVPLSPLELEHRNSTANFAGLPACYQYRLGGFGFGAWRELEAHELANRWVLSGQCAQFALLHAWRAVPVAHPGRSDEARTKPWGNDPVIRRRSTAIAESTRCAALFLEQFPLNLLQWTFDRTGGDPAPAASVWDTEARILEVLAFTNAQGVLHLDPHFENLLTDGAQLFLADWGLALSSTFDLDDAGQAFFEHHQNYDQCTAITSLVHSVTSHLYPKGDWLPTLRTLADGTHEALEELPDTVRAYIAARGPVAVAYTAFYRRLIKDLSTAYPAAELQQMLEAVSG